MMSVLRTSVGLLLLSLADPQAHTEKIYTYVGQIGTDSFVLAWGTTKGDNTIGRSSASLGKAEVRVAGRQIVAERNWLRVTDLLADTEYSYEVFLEGRSVGRGSVRTHPRRADRLAFFVLGDYGTGQREQYEIAEAMWKVFEQRRQSDNPVRFILTTGDNIYSNRILGILPTRSGNKDRHWGPKFFAPYEALLRHIPFYPTLGNHDASQGDLEAYLDNFFFPTLEPARYYRFSFGGLADFLALDSTEEGFRLGDAGPSPESNGQYKWVKESLAQAQAPWKIVYMHHPPFTAGPRHEASFQALRSVLELFQQGGVRVVFSGHEHNFQYSRQNEETGHILYVVSGAGGKVRRGNIRARLESSNMNGWANQHHFLLVEIEEQRMQIWPMGSGSILVRGKDNNTISIPLTVSLSQPQ